MVKCLTSTPTLKAFKVNKKIDKSGTFLYPKYGLDILCNIFN